MRRRGARKDQGATDRAHRRLAAVIDLDTVAKKRRCHNYVHRLDGATVLRVGDASTPTTEWGRYLRRMTSRPGWSVAELARRSGIARQTLFEYIRYGGEQVTIGIVRKIATALEDDFMTALLAAGNISIHASDEHIGRILSADLDDRERDALLDYVQRVREAQRDAMRTELEARLERRLKEQRRDAA